MDNAISWFEIPATDIDRAQKFYETIFQIQMQPMDFEGVKMRMFPIDDPMKGIGGTIIDTGGFHKPSATDGPLIYLNGNPDLQIILDRVVAAGGQVLLPKKVISDEYGDMGLFMDTEGNRIALHNVPAKYLQQ
jgi:predicted enzyme related to lactoylglutathione lyase